MDVHSASRFTLVILSAYLFNRTYSPPVQNFKLPPLGPSFSEKREWFLLRLAVYVYPVLRIAYTTAAFLECLFILRIVMDFDNSTSYHTFLSDYLPFPTAISQYPGYISMLGLLVGIVGGGLRVWCYKVLGDAFTFDITQSSPKLITSGPYSLVRHPSYLAMSLMSSGVSVYHLSPGSWLRESGVLQHGVWRMAVGLWVFTTVFVANVGLALRAEDEDRLMKRMFRKDWEAWRKIVRYKVYPGLY